MCYQEESTPKILVKQELCHTTIFYHTANIAWESWLLDGNPVFDTKQILNLVVVKFETLIAAVGFE